MADISALGELREIEPLDLENYADAKESTFRLPAAGTYTMRAPDAFTFGRTNGGALKAQIDPTIVGPTHEGFTVRYVNVSAKQFDRGGQRVSQLGDYLRACGFRGVLSNEQDQINAVESTAGSIYEAKLEWRAYNKNTQYQVEGMTKFPKLADGTYQSWISDPNDYELDETGEVKTDSQGNKVHKRVRANLVIAFNGFIPKRG